MASETNNTGKPAVRTEIPARQDGSNIHDILLVEKYGITNGLSYDVRVNDYLRDCGEIKNKRPLTRAFSQVLPRISGQPEPRYGRNAQRLRR